jgi:hypothetical protein
MVIPNHKYLVLKMPAPNGVISVADLKTSHSCETENINFFEVLELSKNVVLVVKSAKMIPPEDLSIPENDLATKSQLQPDYAMKAILLRENDPNKTALIGADLDQA